MEAIQGDRGTVYVKDGFVYRSNKVANGVRYVKCANELCYSRSSFTPDQEVVRYTAHNHPPDEVDVEVFHFKAELKRLAAVERRSSREIFNITSQRYPRAALRIGFPTVQKTITRHRRQNQPPIPQSLQEFNNILQSEQWSHLTTTGDDAAQPFYRGIVGGEDAGWTAVLYLSSRLSEAIGNSTRLHVDATFKVLPAGLHAYQLLTIHVDYMNHLFPIAFAVMTSKAQIAYQGVFTYLRDNVPQLNPAVILSDFESGIRNAAKIVWPNARFVGCFFHYSQAVHRMHAQLRMQPLTSTNLEAAKALQMLMALALLPANQIRTGLEVVKYYLQQHNLTAWFMPLLGYMNNYWLRSVGANVMSVCDESHRTNNALEGFYSQLLRTIGAHPSVWAFHEHLRTIEQHQWLDYNRLSMGVPHVRPLRAMYARQNTTIFQATRHLRENRFTVAQFLSRMSHMTQSLVARLSGHTQQPPVAHAPNATIRNMQAAEPVMPPTLTSAAEEQGPQEEDVDINQLPFIPDMRQRARFPRSERPRRRPQPNGHRRRGPYTVPVPPGTLASVAPAIPFAPPAVDDPPALTTTTSTQPILAPQQVPVPPIMEEDQVDGQQTDGPGPPVEQADGPAVEQADGPVVEQASLLSVTGHPYYYRYRTNPTIHRPDIMLPDEIIETQRSELLEALSLGPTEEPSFEADEGQVVCSVCMTNSATRMAIPCAHYVLCRECLAGFVEQVLYHSVTGTGGRVQTTPLRLPITCPRCRALVGQIIPTY